MSSAAETTPPKPLRLGGMALGNGLLVHGPDHWAAAIRGADGAIAVASGRKPRLRARAGDVPGLRGLARLAEALVVIPLVKRALPAARLPFESRGVLATAGAASLAALLLRRRGAEAAALLVSTAPSLMALRSGDVAAYHGAEHKTIGAYESGTEDHSKEHDRCGSHLMAPLLAANLAGIALLRRAGEQDSQLARLGRSRWPPSGPRSRCSPGPSATTTAARPAPCASPATSSSACSARASPAPRSSRSVAPPSPRSSGPRVPDPERLSAAVFRLPIERIRDGYYSDAYFNLTKELLEREGRHPRVLMQVFQKHDALLGGIDEAIAILRECSGERGADGVWVPGWERAGGPRAARGRRDRAARDGHDVEGDYALFAHLETVYLGCLARRTLVMRNVREVVEAARGKPILFFPARHDHWLVQTGDG